jgi:hypothetical protein
MNPWSAVLAISVACSCAPALAIAQIPAGAPDTAVIYFTAGPGFLTRLDLSPWVDLRIRHDAVRDRPNAPNFDRQRTTLRAGLAWQRPSQPLRLEAGLRASLGSDHNRETWSAFDNETADTVEVDRLGVRVGNVAGDLVALGKMRLPVPLTELLWDDDLRPVGIGITSRLAWTGVEGLSVGCGAFTRARFDRDDVRIVAAQLGLERGNPANARGELRASYLGTANRDAMIAQGIARQNGVVATPAGPRLVEAFHVLDLQIAGQLHVGRWPVTMRVDGAMNASARKDDRALRTRLATGGASSPWGIEAGWIYQRIERDALAGAFNSDDWWFHSRSRGHSIFLHAGLGRAASVRVAGFVENRDDVQKDTRRLIAELRWRWGD